jgi:hypothetical protein
MCSPHILQKLEYLKFVHWHHLIFILLCIRESFHFNIFLNEYMLGSLPHHIGGRDFLKSSPEDHC